MPLFCSNCGAKTINGNYVCGHSPAPKDATTQASFNIEKLHCDECGCDVEVKPEVIAEHVDHLKHLRMLCVIPDKQPFWMSWDFFREGGKPEGEVN